jgi:pSer/pThr/pTyr-binding forkhead associated (FHA) protein
MPKLLITSAGKTRQVELGPMETTLGRGKHNDVVLDSILASRTHAVIVVEPAFTIIQDLGSQNGTFVNGERIETQVLVDGDLLRLGGCELRFVSAEQEFSEVEARRLSWVPNWLEDEEDSDEPTAPDDAFRTKSKS